MSFTHLSFDQFEQDQTLNLESSLLDGQKFTGIHMNDVPDYPITPQMVDAFTRIKTMARAAAFAALLKQYPRATSASPLTATPTTPSASPSPTSTAIPASSSSSPLTATPSSSSSTQPAK